MNKSDIQHTKTVATSLVSKLNSVGLPGFKVELKPAEHNGFDICLSNINSSIIAQNYGNKLDGAIEGFLKSIHEKKNTMDEIELCTKIQNELIPKIDAIAKTVRYDRSSPFKRTFWSRHSEIYDVTGSNVIIEMGYFEYPANDYRNGMKAADAYVDKIIDKCKSGGINIFNAMLPDKCKKYSHDSVYRQPVYIGIAMSVATSLL